MSKVQCLAIIGLAGGLAVPAVRAQSRPYIGYCYPAGGQQSSTFQVKLGGQSLEDVSAVLVTGTGVKARIVEFNKKLGPQEITLLNEQLRELKRAVPPQALAEAQKDPAFPGPQKFACPFPPPETAPLRAAASASPQKPAASTPAKTALAAAGNPAPSGDTMMMSSSGDTMMSSDATMMMGAAPAGGQKSPVSGMTLRETLHLIGRIDKRIREYVQRPACASLADIAYVEVTVAPDAAPGERELRLVNPRGVSNPLPFFVGQVPETHRKPMITAEFQVLGKEELALRKRPEEDVECRITLPCTVNGQIASGEINRYRFEARKGQRLVISTLARQLIPYIADAVPGWFQPVVALYDAEGKELAYDDDYRFKPDPLIVYEVPKDGEYVLGIHDAIYRGREDFVYRITIGETPLLSSIFPLGGRAGSPPAVRMTGCNIQGAKLTQPADDAQPGIQYLAAVKNGTVSNRLPFALDTLPEVFEKEANNSTWWCQKITLPVIINGRIDKQDDRDIFKFTGRAGDTVVAEVSARRLESPLDSQIRLTDASGKLLAFNDDREDATAGINTHHADSYFMARLPADGTYYLQIADTARSGGEAYGYRLRVSPPKPDFALRTVPSSISQRGKGWSSLSVFGIRMDGFTNAIQISLKNPPKGISASPVWLAGTNDVTRLSIKADIPSTPGPVALAIEGTAKFQETTIVREAVPAEDKMQAFLWRHLVPAQDLQLLVYDPNYQPPPKRIPKTFKVAQP